MPSGGKVASWLCFLFVCRLWLGAWCDDQRHPDRRGSRGRRHGSAPLVRRQRPRRTGAARAALAVTAEGGTEAALLPRLLSAAEGRGRAAAPIFEPKLRSCDEAEVRAFREGQRRFPQPDKRTSARQRMNMRALVEVAGTFRSLGVPVVLLSGMLLGWRRGCMAVPGDADVDLGTFGPWLAAVGLERLGKTFGEAGHSFETQYCKEGLLSAGCELRITLHGLSKAEKAVGGTPYVDIEVLFSAPPVSVGRMPGTFDKCKTDVCGRSCQHCPLAYGLWASSVAEQSRFFACPLPVGRFQLVAWMNHTFWAPAALEEYLVAEYGEGWPVPSSETTTWPTYRPCQPYMDDDVSFWPYPSFIPGLGAAAAVMEQQEAVERREGASIGRAAAFELELWGQAGVGVPPWRPRREPQREERPEGGRPPWRRPRVLAAAGLAAAAAAACLRLGWRCAGGGGGCARLLEELERLEVRALDSQSEKK